MRIKTHEAAGIRSRAVYSPCERYRYSLTRAWDPDGKRLLFVMLNPSKATELNNDPTIERCERRARALGFGAFGVTNIFAWRDTDPAHLKAAPAPIGPANESHMAEMAAWADQIIAAWGVHGAHQGQGAHVEAQLRGAGFTLYHLGLTKHGFPRHPLYVAYKTPPQLWRSSKGAIKASGSK